MFPLARNLSAKIARKSGVLAESVCVCILVCVFAWIGYSMYGRANIGETYPSKYIDIICPFSAGGGTDLLCRTLADCMSESFGKPVNVQNVAGGGGAVGHVRGASSKADGYSMTMLTFELATLSLRGFAPVGAEDFSFVARLNADPSCVAVCSDFPADNMEEFLKLARGGAKLKFGNSGTGSVWHLAAEFFARKAGIEMSSVSFDGASNAVTAMLGGHIDAVTVSAAELKSHVESGRVKILAVMSKNRLAAFPEVPTCAEFGVDVDFCTWRGIAMPKGVPAEIVDFVGEKLREIAASQRMREFSESTGMNVEYLDGGEFEKAVRLQSIELKPLMGELGLLKGRAK